MDVLVLEPFKESHMRRLQAAAPDATFRQVVNPAADELVEALKSAEVVIGQPHPRALYEQDVDVKWVQMTWAGTDVYTRGRMRLPEGVALTNVAGYAYGHTISQYVIGQILALTQNLAAYVRQQPTMAWRDLGQVASLEGSTVLIYGAGDIGSHVAKRLSGFDVGRVIGVCKHAAEPREHFDQLVTLPMAERLLPVADVVVGCMPDIGETAGYFGERRLRLMKEGSVLVNVGRGNFVDCEALSRVLTDGHLRGAALDVTDPEPLPLRHPLWRDQRCIITPHVSGGAFGHSEETEERICEICCDNLRRWVAGEPLEHRVL